MNNINVKAFMSPSNPPVRDTNAQTHGMSVALNLPVSLLAEFKYRHVSFYFLDLPSAVQDLAEEKEPSRDAFDLLMSSQKDESKLPPKILKEKLTALKH